MKIPMLFQYNYEHIVPARLRADVLFASKRYPLNNMYDLQRTVCLRCDAGGITRVPFNGDTLNRAWIRY